MEASERIFNDVKKTYDILIDHNSNYDNKFNIIRLLFESDKLSGKIFVFLMLLPAILSLVSVIVIASMGLKEWGYLPYLFIFLSYVGYLLYVFISIFEAKNILKGTMKNPLEGIIFRAKVDSIKDFEIIDSLSESSIEAINYVSEYMENEKAAFEKRIGLLVGLVEKIGVFPGFLTLYFAWVKINSVQPGEDFNIGPLEGVVIGILFIYIIGVIMHLYFLRLDRYVIMLNQAKILNKEKSDHF